MAKQNIKIYYFFPVKKDNNDKEKIVDLKAVMIGLDSIKAEKRIIKDGEGNIQLKKLSYDDESKRWFLCFLRNKINAPFKTKLNDDTDTAEALDDDEFVGQECCAIYDETSKIIALQNNRSSISYGALTEFLNKYMNEPISLSVITYKDKYCEISEEDYIEYKSVIIGYTDAGKLKELATMEDNQSVATLGKLANDMSAVNGKIELSVGRSKNFLGKHNLKDIIDFFKRNKGITSNLKVKMIDNDTIRLIDLLNNKASDEVDITITKDDPKTFNKILSVMDSVFDVALEETFDKCNMFINC